MGMRMPVSSPRMEHAAHGRSTRLACRAAADLWGSALCTPGLETSSTRPTGGERRAPVLNRALPAPPAGACTPALQRPLQPALPAVPAVPALWQGWFDIHHLDPSSLQDMMKGKPMDPEGVAESVKVGVPIMHTRLCPQRAGVHACREGVQVGGPRSDKCTLARAFVPAFGWPELVRSLPGSPLLAPLEPTRSIPKP